MFATIALLLLAQASGFWNQDPASWTHEQVTLMLSDSPWARTADDFANRARPVRAAAPSVQVYLASAKPMQLAEEQSLLRFTKSKPGLIDQIRESQAEYREYLKENAGKIIIVAISLDPIAFANANDSNRLETESFLKSGKRKIKMTGHFPPSPSDPVLRLIFPRELDPADKNLTVGVYVPGATFPFRQVQFKISDMMYQGKLEL
ncbi:MAG: hypothetical protein K2Q23_11675 [Bryobacteraceae bacterium]|nr:hypothetical protein [Bryobacteraceae bacterium]